MTFKRTVALVFFSAFCSLSYAAGTEYFGIKMKSEAVAKGLVLDGKPESEFAGQGEILDKKIHATGVFTESDGVAAELTLKLHNDSPEPVSADYQFRDFQIIDKNGKRYPLIDPESQWAADAVEPKSSGTFKPSLGNLVMRPTDVSMIIMSFDLGKAKIFLFPPSKRSLISGLENPPPPPALTPAAEAAPLEHKRTEKKKAVEEKKPLEKKTEKVIPAAKKFVPAEKKAEMPAAEPVKSEAPKTAETAKSPKRNFWDWKKRKKPVQPTATESAPVTLPTASAPDISVPVLPTDAPNRARLDKAITNFKYVPAEAKPAAAAPAAAVAPRSEAQVMEYNNVYGFVTVDIGARDGLKKDAILTVLRNGKTVAKAKVRQIREAVSAAAVLPDSVSAEILPGDKVLVLT